MGVFTGRNSYCASGAVKERGVTVMKKFQQPDFEIIRFEYEDVMVLPSGEMGQGGDTIPDAGDDFDQGQF